MSTREHSLPDARQVAAKRRRTYHYIPKTQYRSSDASKQAMNLFNALGGWIAEAHAGMKRHRLDASQARGINRGSDELIGDVAAALATAVEWDGFSLAHQLCLRGWPSDCELVRICNVWSCAVYGRIMAERGCRTGDFNQG